MGQWGAQRWAAQHDWSYQAILRHYYSHVTLEAGAASTDLLVPNVALGEPWSNHYLTTDRLWLAANTSDDGQTITQTNIYLTTPLTLTRLISETGAAQLSGYLLDISTWGDQPLVTNTLALTAEAFDQLGQQNRSRPVIVGLDRVEPVAHLTTTQTVTPSSVISETTPLTLTLSVSDTTSGVTAMAMGAINWLIEGEVFSTTGPGKVVSDVTALNGSALSANVLTNTAGLWSITNTLPLPAGQAYRAYVRLKISDTAVISEVARLEVVANGDQLIGLHRLRGVDFRANDLRPGLRHIGQRLRPQQRWLRGHHHRRVGHQHQFRQRCDSADAWRLSRSRTQQRAGMESRGHRRRLGQRPDGRQPAQTVMKMAMRVTMNGRTNAPTRRAARAAEWAS
jgi:hypothetical protein